MKFNAKAFSKAIKVKRIIELDQELRVVGEDIKVSASTLSRLENEHIPDLLTYAKVCKWLKKDMTEFIK
jgi:hypothetical protein